MTRSPSRTTDEYDFIGIIDKPRAGVTYKVRNRATGELETLRTLPGASAGDPETRDRFLREIRIHTRLAHPNIAAFHDAFELDGHLVMTAEFIEGSTLAQLCAEGPIPAIEAIRIVSDVLSALEEAHDLGIIHRGISADHVRLTPDGQVKLDGFGLAKPASDIHLTQTGALLGSPRYISPEQVMGVHPLDGRSDLYSVAILLYQALTGHVPFEGPNEFDIMVEQVRAIPRPPAELNPAIQPDLDRLILKMLAKEPDGRLPTASAFRNALNALLAQPAAAQAVPGLSLGLSPPERRSDPYPAAPNLVLPSQTPQPTNLFKPAIVFGTISLTIILTVLLYVTRR
jgi:serine/threonine-protein kinase